MYIDKSCFRTLGKRRKNQNIFYLCMSQSENYTFTKGVFLLLSYYYFSNNVAIYLWLFS